MVVATSEFRKGTKLVFRDEPYAVVEFQHVKPGKGGAFMRTKMKNLLTGLIREETFRSGEKFATPDLENRAMQYLYREDDLFHFMDQATFEQVTLDKGKIEGILDYLKDQLVYTMLYYDEKPIDIAAPMFIELEVTDAPPGVKGDTAQGGGNKRVTLETGMIISVPLFVETGDILKIDTREGKYIERV